MLSSIHDASIPLRRPVNHFALVGILTLDQPKSRRRLVLNFSGYQNAFKPEIYLLVIISILRLCKCATTGTKHMMRSHLLLKPIIRMINKSKPARQHADIICIVIMTRTGVKTMLQLKCKDIKVNIYMLLHKHLGTSLP